MSPSQLVSLLFREKAEAVAARRSRQVEVDGTLVAFIEIAWARDREHESFADALNEEFVLTPVAFVHLRGAGKILAGKRWGLL